MEDRCLNEIDYYQKILEEIRKYREKMGSEVINPLDFAVINNVEIMREDFSQYKSPTLLGYYAISRDNQKIIVYRDGLSVTGIRKVIAHELSHVLIGEYPEKPFKPGNVIDLLDTSIDQYSENERIIESACEKGAREILMPQGVLTQKYYQEIETCKEPDYLIYALASDFKVFIEDMRKRLNEIGLINIDERNIA